MGSGSRDVDAWRANGLYAEDRGLQVPMTLEHPVTSSGKAAPGPDPRIRHRIQIGMFRPIRVDHTNCLQVAIKTHSSNQIGAESRRTRYIYRCWFAQFIAGHSDDDCTRVSLSEDVRLLGLVVKRHKIGADSLVLIHLSSRIDHKILYGNKQT